MAEPTEKCSHLCVTCLELDEESAPSECICHWCLLKHYQQAWSVFDAAMAAIVELGGLAGTLAMKASNDVRGFDLYELPRAALMKSEDRDG